MQHDAPGSAKTRAMLKSYKKVSRWYPALEPVGTDGTAPEPSDAHGGTGFDVPDGPARYPHYIHDDEPEFTIPPVPESVLRRTHFSGAWSDWMTDRESASYTPQLRYRGTTVLEFPWEGAEDGEHATSGRGRPDVASALLDVVGQPDSVKSVSPRQFRRRLTRRTAVPDCCHPVASGCGRSCSICAQLTRRHFAIHRHTRRGPAFRSERPRGGVQRNDGHRGDRRPYPHRGHSGWIRGRAENDGSGLEPLARRGTRRG